MDQVDVNGKTSLRLVPQNIESREDNHITDEELSDLDVMIEEYTSQFLPKNDKPIDLELLDEKIRRSQRMIKYFCYELGQNL